ncbi:MAG: hypothetical protein K2K86_06940 [Muribaculaceae bacterium]|nr:hypothetical protein [Muribaculaceae bacterium]
MKMMIKTTILSLAAVLLAATVMTARDYTKDVDVTVELQPQVRAASRLDVAPRAIVRNFPHSTLQYSGTAVVMPVTPMLPAIQPVGVNPIYTPSPYNGYLVAGYMPWGDFGVSAGYRLIGTASTRLNAMTQLNRNTYKGYMPFSDPSTDSRARLSTTDFELGIDLSQRAGAGLLTAATSLYLSHFNYPGGTMTPSTQNVSDYRLDAKWQSTPDETLSRYDVEAGINRFGFGKACFPVGFGTPEHNPALAEFSWNVGASGQYMFTRQFGLGVSVSYKAASLNRRYVYMPGEADFHNAGRNTRGVLSVGGAFRFVYDSFNGHIGPVVDFGTGDYNSTRTGAQGLISWNVSPYVVVYGTVESGTDLNALATLYDRSRYAAPLSAAGPSFLDGDLKGGFNIGPFRGLAVKLAGGFAKASHWALPVMADGVSTFALGRLNTAYYCASVEYERDRRFSVGAGIQGVVSNTTEHAYYKWTDRARFVIDARVTWRPIDELTLEGGYELRASRKISTVTTMQSDPTEPIVTEYGFLGLGRISAGRVSVNYAFTEQLGAFVRIDGIGQGRYLLPSGMPGQRLRGLDGFSHKF